MVFTDGLSTIRTNVNDRGCSQVHRQGIGDDHRVPPVEGVTGDATGLGQDRASLSRRSLPDAGYDHGTRRESRSDERERDRVACDDAPRDSGLRDDPSDFDPRALNEICSTPHDEDQRHGCLTLRERDAGLVVCIALVIGLVVLAIMLFG